MRKIIAVGHQKNVGKDTFVKCCIDILRVEVRGLRIVQRGFANKLYEFLYSTYAWAGFKTKQYYDEHPQEKNTVLLNGLTARQMLIDVGTPVMRAYDDNIWINACLKNEDYDMLFITDLRFPNEFEAVESMGGFLIRILRPDLPKPTDLADTALDGWDERWHRTVFNNDDRNKLHYEAQNFVLNALLERK